MTLQKLLLKLSTNKSLYVECFVSDGICTITIKEWYTFNIIDKININLNNKINVLDFEKYL